MLDPLTLDQLRVLDAVERRGSFTAAARELGRAQSAVSYSIVSLERTLGVTIFDRSGKVPVLTAIGASILLEGRRLLVAASALRRRAAELSAGLEPELSIAIDPLLSIDVLGDCLHEVQMHWPDLPIRLITESPGRPESHLRAGRVNLAVFPFAEGLNDLSTILLSNIEMIPVVASSHPLASFSGEIDHAELVRHVQLVMASAEVPLGWSRGVVGHRQWRFGDLSTRLQMLRRGFGWCHMPKHVVLPFLDDGSLRRIRPPMGEGFEIALHVVFRAAEPPGEAGNLFVSKLMDAFDGRPRYVD